MSNSIFIFIFGLTLGILISVSLVSRYQRHIPEFQSESNPHLGKITEPSRVGDVAPVNSLSKGPHPVIISNLSETSFEAKLPEKPAASFWIPGREGAFLKFKNSDSTITTSPLVAGIDLISDFFSGNGKNSTDGSGHDSFSSSRRSHARSNAGEGHPTSNVRDISSKIRKGNSGKDEEGIQERVQSSSELDVSSLAGGQRANGKRKRGQKGSRGSLDRRGNSRNNNDSITDISGPGSSGTTGVSAGDDISLQSNFFNERGDRINPLIALMTKGGESDILYNHPPLQPYHIQSRRGHFLLPPYVPSLSSIIAQRAAMLQQEDKPIAGMEVLKRNNFSSGGSSKALPDMTQQKGIFEAENLKLHLCNSVFEAYSGSYLTTKAHMLKVASESYNLTWVNCEMASFIHMKESRRFFGDPTGEGMIVQSLDVLDFSVIHLSAYERSSKKYKHRIWSTKADLKVAWTKIEPVREAGRILETKNNPLISGQNISWSDEARRTVVIMPFLGGAMGAGHSELGNRFEYLKACFWSLYEFFPNIVPGVSRKEDVDWCKKESGLPFYDVLLLENLPKGASLPVATTQRTKQMLQSGKWPFDYVFFTESDQILISRTLPMMYDHLKKYPGRMILPHRLMPYSKEVITVVHKRKIEEVKLNQWMGQSCCIRRQNCVDRKDWKGLADPSVAVIDYYGLYVPLGNVNFLDESYRTCTMTSYIGDYCP